MNTADKPGMPKDLRTENQDLRQRLESLLHEARQNEEKMRRFDQLERCLIGTRNFTELIDLLLADYQAAFGVEYVSLALVDSGQEAARIIESRGYAPSPGLLLIPTATPLEHLASCESGPILGLFSPALHGFLFPGDARGIASIAVLPLVCQGQLIGSLNLGSCVADRYEPAQGTHFLRKLASIVAICLDSSLTHERLRQAGLTDPLTGVHNRRYFEDRCLAEISQAQRHGTPLACMFLDIDRFKRINDTYGHPVGDEVLRMVAAAIGSQLRVSDTVSRYGGEEFVVLLPRTASHHALEIAERIRAAVAGQGFSSDDDSVIRATVSIGLAALPAKAAERDIPRLAEELVSAADTALYRAKRGGRNRVVSASTQEDGNPPHPDSHGAALKGHLARIRERIRRMVDTRVARAIIGND